MENSIHFLTQTRYFITLMSMNTTASGERKESRQEQREERQMMGKWREKEEERVEEIRNVCERDVVLEEADN